MAQKFGGGAPRCDACNERVYKLELFQVDKLTLHKNCFKCSHCRRQLTISNFAAVSGKLFCKTHYLEMFAQSGGKYSVFGDDQFKKKESGAYQPNQMSTGGPTPPISPEKKVKKVLQQSPPPKKKTLEESSAQEKGIAGRILKQDEATAQSSDSEDDSRKAKHRSLKDRLKEYEKAVSSGDDEDGETPKGSPRTAPTGLRKCISSSSSTEKSGLRNAATSISEDEPPKAKKSVGTSSQQITRNAATSFDIRDDEDDKDESGLDIDSMSQEELMDLVTSLRGDNKKLRTKNADLMSQVGKLKAELAVQVAKALEADEWCAKLSKDMEALKGSS